jgi:hypothetical protein
MVMEGKFAACINVIDELPFEGVIAAIDRSTRIVADRE